MNADASQQEVIAGNGSGRRSEESHDSASRIRRKLSLSHIALPPRERWALALEPDPAEQVEVLLGRSASAQSGRARGRG